MRIQDIDCKVLTDSTMLTIYAEPSSSREISHMLEELGEIDTTIDYEINIAKKRKKRSLDANGYMWILSDKIADVIHSTKEDVYRRAVREVGVFNDVAVQEGAPYRELISTWTSNGIGWMCEGFDSELTDRRGNRMKRVRLYKGSSQYDTKQMSRLIDWMVEEAKVLGIETMTPAEIESMMELWRKNNG